MSTISLPVVDAEVVSPPDSPFAELARALADRAWNDARPRVPSAHVVSGGIADQLFVVNGSRLHRLPNNADELRSAIRTGDADATDRALARLGLDTPVAIDDRPLTNPPLRALSLAVAQKCNLGCTYCYAQQGEFGGAAKDMSFDTARRAIDLLLDNCLPGERVNVAFLGGEPLANRTVLRQTTRYTIEQASTRGITVGWSITTNGTLLTPDDADFFEEHAYAVTVSLDGARDDHDRLRPFKSGAGSFDRVIDRVRPLLARQRRMQVSARVTVTPANLNLPAAIDLFVGLEFHSVGFSPLLRAPNGRNEMDAAHLRRMLEEMIACGLAFERKVIAGERYPFLNMTNALRELHRGTHRPYPCGAGAGYLGVSADGDLAACHRFVGDADGAMGSLDAGIDAVRRDGWLAARHVHTQQPCAGCWARYLCGGGCHHEVMARGRTACDFIRGWLHYTTQAYERLSRLAPGWFRGSADGGASQ
ncbi:MAG TPA: radical SAM protein [Gemmataceae bacterium]|nr:radical SAM protein [Gemmataceae bacterium]